MGYGEVLQILSILVPILVGGFSAYVKLREEMSWVKDRVNRLSSDIDNLADMIGTKRACGEKKEREGLE